MSINSQTKVYLVFFSVIAIFLGVLGFVGYKEYIMYRDLKIFEPMVLDTVDYLRTGIAKGVYPSPEELNNLPTPQPAPASKK